jgi:uncharacterized protein with FMN-binding domain
MKRSTISRPIPAILITAGAVLHPGSASAATSHTYKGPSVGSIWGPVEVDLVVTGKKITNVKAITHPPEPPSQAIEAHALPILRKEVLKAQSAKIHAVSGATITSTAYIKSLKGALKKAHMM